MSFYALITGRAKEAARITGEKACVEILATDADNRSQKVFLLSTDAASKKALSSLAVNAVVCVKGELGFDGRLRPTMRVRQVQTLESDQ
jgi:hypothetical protein